MAGSVELGIVVVVPDDALTTFTTSAGRPFRVGVAAEDAASAVAEPDELEVWKDRNAAALCDAAVGWVRQELKSELVFGDPEIRMEAAFVVGIRIVMMVAALEKKVGLKPWGV